MTSPKEIKGSVLPPQWPTWTAFYMELIRQWKANAGEITLTWTEYPYEDIEAQDFRMRIDRKMLLEIASMALNELLDMVPTNAEVDRMLGELYQLGEQHIRPHDTLLRDFLDKWDAYAFGKKLDSKYKGPGELYLSARPQLHTLVTTVPDKDSLRYQLQSDSHALEFIRVIDAVKQFTERHVLTQVPCYNPDDRDIAEYVFFGFPEITPEPITYVLTRTLCMFLIIWKGRPLGVVKCVATDTYNVGIEFEPAFPGGMGDDVLHREPFATYLKQRINSRLEEEYGGSIDDIKASR